MCSLLSSKLTIKITVIDACVPAKLIQALQVATIVHVAHMAFCKLRCITAPMQLTAPSTRLILFYNGILFIRRDIKAVQDTRVFRGANIESAHRLMVCKLPFQVQKASQAYVPSSLTACSPSQGSRQGSIPVVHAGLAGHTPPHPYWGWGEQLRSPQKQVLLCSGET